MGVGPIGYRKLREICNFEVIIDEDKGGIEIGVIAKSRRFNNDNVSFDFDQALSEEKLKIQGK